MKDELCDLYQEAILEHSKSPRNFHRPSGANREAEGYNPLCGDHYSVFLAMEGDTIREVGFEGSGCAISRASGSIMTQLVKGKTRMEAAEIFSRFHDLVTGKTELEQVSAPGKMAVFAGVSKFPARVKCATLAWRTLQSALQQKEEVVTTESGEDASVSNR